VPHTIVRATMATASEIQASEAHLPEGAAAEPSAQVNAAGSHPRGVLRWGYFIVLNAIAGVFAIAIFIGMFYADGIDPYLRGTYNWLLAHPGVTSFFAFSPLTASMLVGWGYSQRAKKRKAAAARAEAAAALVSGHDGAASGPKPQLAALAAASTPEKAPA
jgi:hypothetical protein